jgi:hypothetical protein
MRVVLGDVAGLHHEINPQVQFWLNVVSAKLKDDAVTPGVAKFAQRDA